MEIYEEEEDSGNEGDSVIATFQPLRDDSFGSFNVHKGILIFSMNYIHIYIYIYIYIWRFYPFLIYLYCTSIHLSFKHLSVCPAIRLFNHFFLDHSSSHPSIHLSHLSIHTFIHSSSPIHPLTCLGPVFVVSIHPSSSLVVTGGQDDTAFVWNLDDQQIVFECTGIYIHISYMYVCRYMYVCMYACMYVCMYVCICMYVGM